MMKNLFFILFAIGILFYSPAEASVDHDDDLVVIGAHKRSYELFPQQFTASQVSCFFYNEPVEVANIGTFSVDDVFKKNVMPSNWQLLTGWASQYAGKIKFTGTVKLEGGELKGLYEYRSTYSPVYKAFGYSGKSLFSVTLKLDDQFSLLNGDKVEGTCRVINMKQALLWDKDFVSSANQLDTSNNMVPDASIFYLKFLDEEWLEQTPSVHRLEQNIKLWLQVLYQLREGALYDMETELRDAKVHELYEEFVRKEGFDPKNMTKESFSKCLLCAREQILKEYDLTEQVIPTLESDDLVKKLYSGHALFAIPEGAGKFKNA